MATEPNNQVMQLWQQQSQMLEQTPRIVAEHIEQIGAYLGTLHDRAEGNPELIGLINGAWERVQGIRNLVNGQTTVLNSAGIIIPALKVQRDELALELNKLLEVMGHTDGSPIEGFMSALYDSWRDTLDDEDIVSDGQDDLLEQMADDLLTTWNVPLMLNARWVFRAIRGSEEMPEESAQLFQAFLDSLDSVEQGDE